MAIVSRVTSQILNRESKAFLVFFFPLNLQRQVLMKMKNKILLYLCLTVLQLRGPLPLSFLTFLSSSSRCRLKLSEYTKYLFSWASELKDFFFEMHTEQNRVNHISFVAGLRGDTGWEGLEVSGIKDWWSVVRETEWKWSSLCMWKQPEPTSQMKARISALNQHQNHFVVGSLITSTPAGQTEWGVEWHFKPLVCKERMDRATFHRLWLVYSSHKILQEASYQHHW